MTWDPTFKTAIAQRAVHLVFAIRRAMNTGIDDAWQAATTTAVGAVTGTYPAHLGGRLRVGMSGAFLPRDWRASSGRWSAEVVGEEAAQEMIAALRAGSVIQALAGQSGADVASWEGVALGQIRDRRYDGGARWVIEAFDMLAALRSRLTNDSNKAGLFPYMSFDPKSVFGSAYSAGDPSMTVSETEALEFDSGTGQGVIQVEGDGGDSFYLTYTGLSTSGGITTISGLSSGGQFGTTVDDAAIGNKVAAVAWLKGHPLTLLMKILTSTGTGSNGAFDTLPETWGYGIPERYVDIAGITDVRDNVMQIGGGVTYQWSILIEDVITGGLSWLRDLLASAGVILSVCQGQITVRAIQNPYRPGALFLRQITDDGIISGSLEFLVEDPEVPGLRSVRATTTTATGGTESEDYNPPSVLRDSLPHQALATLDLSGAIRADASDHLNEILNRVGPWYVRTPAKLTATWAGLEFADLALGDELLFTAGRYPLFGVSEAAAGTRYSLAPATVTAHEVDWENHRVKMTLHLLPPSSST